MAIHTDEAIRAALKLYGGMTTDQVANTVGIRSASARVTLKAMPDAYIDRWVKAKKPVYWVPVWELVDVPEDAPRPDNTGSDEF